MVGIYDCFGYGAGYDIPFAERYKLIKEAGFESVMLWWSDKFGRGTGYQKDVQYARDAGLIVENMHAPVHEQNSLSASDLAGDDVFHSYLQCIDDCCLYEIPVVVIHLPNDQYPINELGMERLDAVVQQAEKKNVKVAFENLNNLNNLSYVLNAPQSTNVGFCYDSCHHANYSPQTDLLGMYGSRLFAVHLHDNGGKHNQHQLPFDGSIDWKAVMESISLTEYKGATTLEPMNWDYEHLTIREFLERSYCKAKQLDDMRYINRFLC